MTEGQQTDSGEAPANKVVRLPRDWLGSRENLVPFGPGSLPPAIDASVPDYPEVVGDAPPSAEDFWGERSAAIHGALQAPADDAPVAGAPARERHQPTSARRTGARRIRGRPIPRRRFAAAASVAALGAALVIALLSAASPHESSHAARLNVAAILSSGINKILNIGSPRIAPPRKATRARLHSRHFTHHARKPPPQVVHHTPSPRPAPIYAVRAAPAHAAQVTGTYDPRSAAPQPHLTTRTPAVHSSTPSRASASPTGQAGALGPVSSPNG